MNRLAAQEKEIDRQLQTVKEVITAALRQLPNIPAVEVPSGKDESENKVIKTVGEPPVFDFTAQDYLSLATRYDLIDTERAAKISGSRFGYLKHEGALLWNALVQYAQSILLREKFVPFYSPVLVRREVMEDTGYDSYTDDHEAYYIEKDALFLVGTGEHALVPYHRNEILDEKELPLRYTTYSTCFRREAGSYGRDTKGILRVHQFDKQEMVVITTPNNSEEVLNELLAIQEKIVRGLGLPYQLLAVCTGDLPKPSAKVIDLECWIPSEGKYRETHSVSNCTDYQARRNTIRYRGGLGKTRYPHILNGTAVTARLLIALLENYQQADGTIKIPEVLHRYMHGQTVIPKR